jgi:galactose mutarotase-like enzyme
VSASPESSPVRIASESLELLVLPELGGKVVALRCLRHRRQWLVEHLDSLAPTQDGSYGPAEAWGWDELFPTVLPGAAAPAPWRAPLRDHGELWERPWEVTERDERRLGLAYVDAELGFRFERTLEVEGARVSCRYRVTSRRDDPLPFQWSMHPILSLEPGEQLMLAGVQQVRATGSGHPALPDAPAVLDWPVHDGLALGTVRSCDGQTILKLYADARPSGRVMVTGRPCELSVTTDVEHAPYVGIYVNYGGWPAGGSLHHVGIEPTNAPEDDLDAAVRSGRVDRLPPGGSRSWSIEISLGRRCAG